MVAAVVEGEVEVVVVVAVAARHLVEHREEEAARLARSGLRARHHVAARDPDRERVALHRRRLDELRRVDVRLQPRVQRDVGKLLHRRRAVLARRLDRYVVVGVEVGRRRLGLGQRLRRQRRARRRAAAVFVAARRRGSGGRRRGRSRRRRARRGSVVAASRRRRGVVAAGAILALAATAAAPPPFIIIISCVSASICSVAEGGAPLAGSAARASPLASPLAPWPLSSPLDGAGADASGAGLVGGAAWAPFVPFRGASVAGTAET